MKRLKTNEDHIVEISEKNIATLFHVALFGVGFASGMSLTTAYQFFYNQRALLKLSSISLFENNQNKRSSDYSDNVVTVAYEVYGHPSVRRDEYLATNP